MATHRNYFKHNIEAEVKKPIENKPLENKNTVLPKDVSNALDEAKKRYQDYIGKLKLN